MENFENNLNSWDSNYQDSNYQDPLVKAKDEVREQGMPVYMSSEYCKNFTAKHGNCDKCEYFFACDEILKNTVKNSVKELRKVFLEVETLQEENEDIKKIFNEVKLICPVVFNTEKCFGNCNECEHSKICDLFFTLVFSQLVKNQKI